MGKICTYDGCNYPIFSKGFCKFHYPKKSIKKISEKGKIKKEDKKKLIEKDFNFYLTIWDNCEENYQNHWCYECGKGLSEPLITYFHHLLFKSNYPQFRHEVKNICIICDQCHNQVHSNIDKVPKVKLLTEQIKKLLYDI